MSNRVAPSPGGSSRRSSASGSATAAAAALADVDTPGGVGTAVPLRTTANGARDVGSDDHDRTRSPARFSADGASPSAQDGLIAAVTAGGFGNGGSGRLVHDGDVEGGDPAGGKMALVAAYADGGEDDGERPQPLYVDVTWGELAKEFSLLGYIAFGGPAAHIGLFSKRLVEKKRWMSAHRFLELFALAGCLPGPTSTQLSFALGTVKKGVLGGLLSGALFQYPGAVIMTGLGIASANVLQTPPEWLTAAASGVSAVGVGFVASATKGLLMKICVHDDKWTAIMLQLVATLAAATVIYWRAVPWLFPLTILAGALVMLAWNWKKDMSVQGEDDEAIAEMGIRPWHGVMLIVAWLTVLIIVLVLARTLDYDHRADATPLDWFEVFYRTGSIIYGGGQVVLPLLLGDLVVQDCDYTVDPPVCVDDPELSWMTTLQFYTGLGLVQAMPGPLFNLAAYLGAIIAYNAGYFPLVGTVLAWIGLFAPGVILMFALLPFWTYFRKWHIYRAALPGMNSASVGLILAAVFNMTIDVYVISPFPTSTLVIGLFAFVAVDQFLIFEPFVVLGGIGLGLLAWGADLR